MSRSSLQPSSCRQMHNSPQTQHRGSAGQGAHTRLILTPLPTALGTCQVGPRLISTLLHRHPTPARVAGSMMLQTCATMIIQLRQLLTAYSLLKDILGMTTGWAPRTYRLGVIWRLRIPLHHACTNPSSLPQLLAKSRILLVHLTVLSLHRRPAKWSCIRDTMISIMVRSMRAMHSIETKNMRSRI